MCTLTKLIQDMEFMFSIMMERQIRWCIVMWLWSICQK